MIVFGHREPWSPSELGFSTEPDQPVSAPLDMPLDPLLEDLQGEVEGLQPDSAGGGADELGGAAVGGLGGGGSSEDQHNPDALMLEALADEPSSEPATIVVDDVELSLDSTLSTLRKVPWSWKVRLKGCGFQEAEGQAQQAQAFGVSQGY